MHLVDCSDDSQWLQKAIESIQIQGFVVLANVLDSDFVEETNRRMYAVQKRIHQVIEPATLDAAGELGVLRGMMKFDEWFLRFLEVPELLAIVDNTVSETAVMHLQNGFILPSIPKEVTPSVFQNKYHMDFKRVLNGYMASVNVFVPLVDFTENNGATIVVPGTHQRENRPTEEYLRSHAIPVVCSAGSMIVFDSTLYHASGRNSSGSDRLSINHQFTRSYFKQQIDYVRYLGKDMVERQKPRTQQLLGWYTRVATTLEEYYQPPEQRLYRAGQG